MGRDKARLPLGGRPLALRVARALQQVAYPVLAVGGAAGTGLETVRDRRQGPLAALASGARWLARHAMEPPAMIVVACDLPLIEAKPLLHVRDLLLDGIEDAVVPLVAGRPQPLAACYSLRAARRAIALVHEGARAMQNLLDAISVRYEPMDAFARELWDVDTPDDYADAKRILEGPA